MKLNDRQQMILNLLKQNGQVRVSLLAKDLFASEMSIRRDLEYLENEGLLSRCHGGAIPIGNQLHYPIKYRTRIHAKEKKELALRARPYLRDNMVLFFNSSSTSAHLVPYLKEYKNISVITNSMFLVSQLEPYHIPCTVTGGTYHEIEGCLTGGMTERYLSNVHPDLAILSCEGFTEDGIVTDSVESMASIARIACENAKKALFLMDGSKKGALYTYTVCKTDGERTVLISV